MHFEFGTALIFGGLTERLRKTEAMQVCYRDFDSCMVLSRYAQKRHFLSGLLHRKPRLRSYPSILTHPPGKPKDVIPAVAVTFRSCSYTLHTDNETLI